MAGGQERVLRRRIRSVQSTKKITRAMELIAAVADRARPGPHRRLAVPTCKAIAEVLAETAAERAGATRDSSACPSRPSNVLVVVHRRRPGPVRRPTTPTSCVPPSGSSRAGSDQGASYRLDGGRAGRPSPTSASADQPVDAAFSACPTGRPSRTPARVAAAVAPPFLAGEVDLVQVVSTRFLSAGSQVVETRQLSPSAAPSSRRAADERRRRRRTSERTGRDRRLTEFEPDAEALLGRARAPLRRGAPSSPPCSRRPPPSTPPASGPWRRPPRTPTS